MPLFLALLIVPLIEIGLFIEVGGLIGLWPTLAVVVLTALLGTVLLRAQGLAALAELRGRIERGQDPSATLAHGAMILVAGVVLLTPGFFTDAIGFLLLIPPVRAAIIRRAAHRVVIHAMNARTGGPGTGPGRPPHGASRAGGQTIEGEFEEIDPAPGDDRDGRAG